MRLKPAITTRLSDPESERVRRNLDERVSELQQLPAAGMRVIQDISLPDSTTVPVAHGLGRKPLCILVSPPRGATSTGRIVEVRSASSGFKREQVVLLRATGHGATITVDLIAL